MTGDDPYYWSSFLDTGLSSPAAIAGLWALITTSAILIIVASFTLIMCCKGDEVEAKVEKKSDDQQGLQTKTDKKTTTNVPKMASVDVNAAAVDQQPTAKLTIIKKTKTTSPDSPPGGCSTFKGGPTKADSVAKLINIDSFSAKTDLVFILGGANATAANGGVKKCAPPLAKVGGSVSPPPTAPTTKKNFATPPTFGQTKRAAAGVTAVTASSIAGPTPKK